MTVLPLSLHNYFSLLFFSTFSCLLLQNFYSGKSQLEYQIGDFNSAERSDTHMCVLFICVCVSILLFFFVSPRRNTCRAEQMQPILDLRSGYPHSGGWNTHTQKTNSISNEWNVLFSSLSFCIFIADAHIMYRGNSLAQKPLYVAAALMCFNIPPNSVSKLLFDFSQKVMTISWESLFKKLFSFFKHAEK